MKEEILRRLRSAEEEHSVRILYACESGSRAWGFASPDSDYERHGESFSGQGRPDILESAKVREELNGIFRAAVLDMGGCYGTSDR
jgi:hypothetical protein